MVRDTNDNSSVAYFSMEIGLDEGINTYSGGLGVLAGDTISSAADFKVPMAAVTLLYRKGTSVRRSGPTDGNGRRLRTGRWKSTSRR